MPKRWVIPDTHGHIRTVEALFEEIIRPNKDDEIWFLGDYIDRGPDSRGVIDFIRNLQETGYRVTALKGNHEDMLVELYDIETQSKSSWFNNAGSRRRSAWMEMGGRETLRSFKVSSPSGVPSGYIEWMRGLPYYVLLDDFALVHAGFNFRNQDPFEDTQAMLWLRDYEIRPEKIGNRRIIHGHVPVNLEMINLTFKNPGYPFIDLDNGIYVRGYSGYGNLVTLELTSWEMWIQRNESA